ncbi:tryptophan-rich sensory protein [Gemmobacter fulvus]|uniref:Tryptophan-rich sensory protein n=1 Tax=Gemmobacter fulvus TaxID=2840474 RepID=A0A975S075_9RHOB|nr:TspO/MBR family protein [Gemmobacter fulvus]MBT9247155.1 tryptophan-rich sensory protein [Gemmobacter fulvus]MDQ1849897.1 TspO/MBR family protein [Gemmobacter fulvus]QWK88971.1 tryptophan-rich sensory protein [Gemmobacter fulvus]
MTPEIAGAAGFDWQLAFLFLIASAAAGLTGVLFKPGAWYESLVKPDWRPKNWMFPVAWTTIYVLSALAAARVAPLAGNAYAMAFWAMQIALNTLWTPVFFGARRMGLSVAVMGLLCCAVLGMLWTFWSLDGWAFTMILPYAIWLGLAAPLNWRVWRDNPGANFSAEA